MDIVDSHIHIWRKQDPALLSSNRPHFIGDYDAIRGDYLVADLLRDANSVNVAKFVYVQTWPRNRSVEETRWVQSVCERSGHPSAIVGFADLTASDVEDTLRKQMESPAFRGIRMALNWHERESFRAHYATPDMMRDARFLSGMATLEQLGLSFDIQALPHQLGDAAEMVARFPGVTFVLDHAGLPHDRSAAGLTEWTHGMRLLAARPNVFVKLSGLGMFTHDWSPQGIEPIVHRTIDIFGAERAMFGSNFPIEKLWVDYTRLFETLRECLSDLSGAATAAVLGETAKSVYRL
jgi:predicted TIM-barrel fold metal-dependent hydrolase